MLNRLTFRRTPKSGVGYSAYCCNHYDDCEQAVKDRLADLEDKIERGELVEVVRCKDCKYSDTKYCLNGTVYCYKHETFYNDDFKCEHGERSVG